MSDLFREKERRKNETARKNIQEGEHKEGGGGMGGGGDRDRGLGPFDRDPFKRAGEVIKWV